MRVDELKSLVQGSGDAAFATDDDGIVIAWNAAATALFGRTSDEAIGRSCAELLQGEDECGSFCSRGCAVQRAVHERRPVGSYDLNVATSTGKRWCNTSIVIANVSGHANPYTLHILRDVDTAKRLELLLKDFVAAEHAPAHTSELTTREIEVLRLIAKGATSRDIASQLHISATTVSNHVQHVLHKLNAHTRLQAVRRAETSGLI